MSEVEHEVPDESPASTPVSAPHENEDDTEPGADASPEKAATETPDHDDDDEEDDDEEDDDEDEGKPRKRRRKSKRNQFLDVEAEVDDEDEEELTDDELLEGEEGFIQSDNEDVGRIDSSTQRRRHAELTKERFTGEDAEKMADEYRERYGRSSTAYRGDTGVVPQRMLLPSVNDPSIFRVNCRIGKEKEAVRAIQRRLQNMSSRPDVFSCFQRDAFGGSLYIEARNQSAVIKVCNGIPNIFTNRLLLVPIKEYPDLLRARKSKEVELVPGTYVRVKRGLYAGDLALVENLSESGLEVQLKLVPRLSYGRSVLDSTDMKRKRGADRPPQRLFNASDAKQLDPKNFLRNGAAQYTYNNEDFSHGFLIKDFKLSAISTDNVSPTLEEITKLTSNSEDGGLDLQALSESVRKDMRVQNFQPGESVEVTRGELMGLKGKVRSANGDIVAIVGTEDQYKGMKVNVPTEHLRKYFSQGDHVRVTAGNYKDDTGMVVHREKDKVTLLSDLSKTEITVFSKDLKMASEIGGSNILGKYTLHDLVQLNAQMVGCIVDIEREQVKVLAQDGQVLTVAPSSIVMKVTSGRQVATDHNGRQIEPGDTVKESVGERRQGTILHLYHQFVFLHNREITENLGVFVNRVSNVVTISTKGARDEKGLDLSKMNPMAVNNRVSQPPPQQRSFVNTRRLVGKKASIGPGSQYKGLTGLIKDVNDTTARIELEARNKIIAVDVTKLLFEGPNKTRIPYGDFIRGPSFRPPTNMGPPQIPSGSRTPWGGSGSKTPTWGGAGSRTPSWQSGSKTPAYGAWNDSGNRTPAWNSSNRTAWNDGSRTPWGGSGWDRSAPTPSAYGSSATPGVSSVPYESAPTPYATAKTPAAVATPAAWGGEEDNEDDEIKYEPATP